MGTLIQPGQRVLTLDPNVAIPRRAVAAPAGGNWYDGLTAAYQAKGAASYAVSKVNLANPGTYDLSDGPDGGPSWDGVSWYSFGWNTYLATGISGISAAYSMLVLFSDAPSGSGILAGAYTGESSAFFLLPNWIGLAMYNTTLLNPGGAGMVSGVACIAGQTLYRDGVAEPGTATAGTPTARELLIGGCNGLAGFQFAGKIQAVGIKNDTLTAGEVATISAAMAAL